MRNRHPGPTQFIQQTPNLTCQFRRKQVSSLPAPEPRVAGGPRVRILLPPARSQQRTVFEKACYRNPCPGYAAALSDAPAISAAIKQITIFACVGRTHEIRMEPAQQAEITRVLSSVGEHSCALASRYRFFDAMLGMALAGCQKRHQVLSSKLDGLYLATRRDAKVDPQKSPSRSSGNISA